MEKQYVEVIVKFKENGEKVPLSILYENKEYIIDKVMEVKPKASLKVGGFGVRYSVRIQGVETHLFYEFDRWFVEKK